MAIIVATRLIQHFDTATMQQNNVHPVAEYFFRVFQDLQWRATRWLAVTVPFPVLYTKLD